MVFFVISHNVFAAPEATNVGWVKGESLKLGTDVLAEDTPIQR